MMETRQDQLNLLKNLLTSVTPANRINIKYASWAAAYVTGSDYVTGLVAEILSQPDPLEKRDIEFAIARMGVTNPYFIAREFVDLRAGGTLTSLNFSSFAHLNVHDEVAYHHACVAISMINGGHICLRSHVGSLRKAGISDESIDVTMRIAAACHSLNIIGNLPDHDDLYTF